LNNFIYEIINQKIDFLKHSYKTNKIVNHQGIKGSLNEILLEELNPLNKSIYRTLFEKLVVFNI